MNNQKPEPIPEIKDAEERLLTASKAILPGIAGLVSAGITVEQAIELAFIKGAAWGIAEARSQYAQVAPPPLVIVVGPRPQGMPPTPRPDQMN